MTRGDGQEATATKGVGTKVVSDRWSRPREGTATPLSIMIRVIITLWSGEEVILAEVGFH